MIVRDDLSGQLVSQIGTTEFVLKREEGTDVTKIAYLIGHLRK